MPLPTTRPEITGTFGAVASTHWLASQTGMGVLERGGNAFDAAAAAGFVLQVVEPHLNGPGSDLPIVLWSAAGGADGGAHVVCGQGPVPAAATPQAFADLGLTAIPGSGLLPATVPGAFGAWTLLLQRWGTWRLRDVLEPAIGYARHGAPVLPRVAATLESVTPLFLQGEGAWTTSAATYLTGDDGAARAPQPWSRLRLTALADTYDRVLAAAEAAGRRGGGRDAEFEAAREYWYRGEVADVVDRFFSATRWRDATGAVHAGLLRGSDLAAWEPTIEPPAVGGYRDVQVLKTGTWGQGPVLLQALALLDGQLDGVDEDDDDWVHACAAAFDLAVADREAWYGDPVGAEEDGADVPSVTELLDPAYTASRRALLGEYAESELQPGWPGGTVRRLPQLPEPPRVEALADAGPAVGEPTVDRREELSREELGRGDTVHVDVADRWGNLVSATPSGGWLQSSPVIPELGFALGTRAQMCWLPGGGSPRSRSRAARWGSTLGSTLRPGRRPRTTLSPTLLLRDGEPWMALGTPGGDQQDAWQLPFVIRLAHASETALQAAVDAPTFHTETAPSSFWPRQEAPAQLVIEERFGPSVAAGLTRRGWDVRPVDGWSLGRLSAVALDGGWIRAAANPRGAQGYAVGR
ncbi:gamma-glutamyltranspeptidase / glutathione hydrolase [Quadrisphaera granulorum]|uniref:Gamma-glutamyltranspeptidase/glutathione hydrolase n=1 Tax=Quadrisphaera granulorum TaxID=317664 RepID=A0A316ABV1_9ACTN|nr:gamma-glutamyltransferase [Quadrisphaera granulorum]PWJ55185.1 gamma-glutamyltranspeptidase/glutathione hydrolase [Quadrisphaera granulorum]SZE95694.1 gamma-glutamyltranspeptidase / glutathione hydrolase [Quadrisphaera granulorum]